MAWPCANAGAAKNVPARTPTQASLEYGMSRRPTRAILPSHGSNYDEPLSVRQEVCMRSALRAVVFLVWSGLLCPVAAGAQANPDWHRAIPGFKIAGNQGNILINRNFT